MRSLVFATLLLTAACGAPQGGPSPIGVERTAPMVGSAAPAATLVAADGTQLALADRFAQQSATVVVFYRGFY